MKQLRSLVKLLNIKIERAAITKPKPQDPKNLVFGTVFTDHMFSMYYSEGKGWHNAKIMPYSDITLNPAASCLHYAQLIFEGLKAYKDINGKPVLFRPEQNIKRFNNSGAALCMPAVDVDFVLNAIEELISVEEDWIPTEAGTSLYVRPFMLSTEPFLGVRASKEYRFLVILSPCGPYYKEGLNPIKIMVEEKESRTVEGGIGTTKAAANYAASLHAQIKANEKGFAQVLWLDGRTKKNVDEVGSMNIFFVIDGKVITPSLDKGTILPGITRDSILTITKSWGMETEEREISIEEVIEAHKTGRLTEVFGAGTAAVVSPVGEMNYRGESLVISGGNIGEISKKLYDTVTGIQYGRQEDKFGWVYPINA